MQPNENFAQSQYPRRRIDYVEADFALDGDRHPKRSGYRPLWRMERYGSEPLVVGMNEMTLVEREWLRPGETSSTRWVFAPEVQGHIEEALTPGASFDVCEGNVRVGVVRVTRVVYRDQ